MKRKMEKYDFQAFDQAIKVARKAKGIWRNQLADQIHIAPRYIAYIKNSGQHLSLETLFPSNFSILEKRPTSSFLIETKSPSIMDIGGKFQRVSPETAIPQTRSFV